MFLENKKLILRRKKHISRTDFYFSLLGIYIILYILKIHHSKRHFDYKIPKGISKTSRLNPKYIFIEKKIANPRDHLCSSNLEISSIRLFYYYSYFIIHFGNVMLYLCWQLNGCIPYYNSIILFRREYCNSVWNIYRICYLEVRFG
jgi:hypothetical protein